MTTGDVYTVAGNAGGSSGFSGDGGPATQALLDVPVALAVDNAGNLYIADESNSRVQEVAASSGTQRRISMTAGTSTRSPGARPEASG